MKTIQLIVLFFLLLLNIVWAKIPLKSLATINDEEVKELKLGETYTIYSLETFKYNNLKEKEYTIIFYFINHDKINFEIKDPDGVISTNLKGHNIEVKITKTGIYYFKIESIMPIWDLENEFTTIIPGEVIDTINLNKPIYLSKLSLWTRELYNATIYKINTLNEDKDVFFEMKKYLNNENPFQICNDDLNICESNITFYHFKKNYKYTIYISFVKGDSLYYYYPPYAIIPVIKSNIETITSGVVMSSIPKIFNINLENRTKYIHFQFFHKILIAPSNSPMTVYSDIFQSLNFNEIENNNSIMELSNDYKYRIVMVIPSIFDRKIERYASRIAVSDYKIETIEDEEIIIPSKKSAIVSIPLNFFYRQSPLSYYNVLTSFSSSIQNIRYIYSNNLDNKFNYLFYDYVTTPIFIEQSSSQQKINVKTYYPKYALYAVGDSDIFKLFVLYYLGLYFETIDRYRDTTPIDWENLTPVNFRINSNVFPLYEFLNLYLNGFEDNLNVYIKRLYGETELYECSDDLDLNDLSILRTPINSCKDKKSIFNRLFTFKGRKTLSGYLSPNSYFDIYLEYNYDPKIIRISHIFKKNYNSGAKFIKKDEIYTVDFTLEHMVKIEIVDNIEVTIYNDTNTIVLNSDIPNVEINGSGYKVKSNYDTMIYFYGKLYPKLIQKKIFSAQEGSKYIKIGFHDQLYFIIDSGFEGYNPINVEIVFTIIDENRNLYIENIYNKIKNKLVKNESIYLFYAKNLMWLDEDDIKPLEISYHDCLNNENNDYSFDVIPNNSEEKSLIIYNSLISTNNNQKIFYHVNFCGEPHDVTMFYNDESDDISELTFNKNIRYYIQTLRAYGAKLNFKSDKEFVFSYSFVDKEEENFAKYEPWLNERKELKELEIINITNITNKTDDNIISIIFKPNYKNSNTKYIIVIAPENEENTVESFSNPCYIAKLVNNKQNGVKIENWFDPGLDDTITAEVDITNILNKENNKYVIGIISQELRFDKKLNFYSAYNFSYETKQKEESDTSKSDEGESESGGSKSDGNNDDNKGKNNGKDNSSLIIILSIVGAFVVLLAICFIICIKRKKNSIDLEQNSSLKQNDKLLVDY